MNARGRQEGGSHYRDLPAQPIDFILTNGLGFCEGNVVKYVCRWRVKGGVEDLRKARHYLDLLIESASPSGCTASPTRSSSAEGGVEPERPDCDFA